MGTITTPGHAENPAGAAGKVHVAIHIGETDESGDTIATIVQFELDMGTPTEPFNAAEHAVNCVSGDVTRGWAGNPLLGEGFSELAKPYDRPGRAKVYLTVLAVEESTLIVKTVDTTGSLVRAIRAATQAAADEADVWLRSTRKRVTGAKW